MIDLRLLGVRLAHHQGHPGCAWQIAKPNCGWVWLTLVSTRLYYDVFGAGAC